MNISKRGDTFHVRRRVPKRFSRVEDREFFATTLNTDSESEAREQAPAVWKSALAGWEAKLAGDSSDAEAQFEVARDLARARGFRYLPAHKAAQLPLDEIVRRVEAATFRNGRPDKAEMRAFLGTAQEPNITVTRALEIYWKVADAKTLGKSAGEIRIWRNGRIKAIGNFIKVVGNMALDEITADAMQDFHDWQLARIRDEGLTPNSTNKDLTNLCAVLKTVNKQKRLGLTLPLEGFAFSEAEKGQRAAFAQTWIRDHIVGNPRLGGLITEARCILLGMVNTGYLSTILDDYSRYVNGWKLCGNMRAEDVTDTLDIALAASGCDSAKVLHKPRLLSDRAIEGATGSSPMARGSSYIAGDLAEYLEDKGMTHVRGAPMHPQTQGKIERWHQTLKNRILLENYFLEGELEAAIAAFIDHYNNHRYHESIGNLSPADVYFGRGETILTERRRIKQQTIKNRRLNHTRQAA